MMYSTRPFITIVITTIIVIVIIIIIITTMNIIIIITIYSIQTSTLQRLRKDYQIVDDYYTSRSEVALSSSTTSSRSSSSSSSSIQSKLPEQSNIATAIVASLPDSLSVVIDEMNGRVEQVGEIKYVFESSQNGIISGKYVLISGDSSTTMMLMMRLIMMIMMITIMIIIKRCFNIYSLSIYMYQHPTVLYAGMYSIMRKIAVLQTGKKPSNETDIEVKPSNETVTK